MENDSKQTKVYILFELFQNRYPERGSIETKLAWWRHDFEKDGNVLFYKCVCFRDNQKLKDDFKLKITPTIIFLHNGIEIDRLDKLNEINPNYFDQTKPGQEIGDETSVKNIIKEWKSTSEKQQNSNK